MSRQKLPSWTLPVSWACLALWAVVMALALAGCSAGEQGSTWPESAEFSTLEGGQDRWSVHDTGEYTTITGNMHVVVDHRTGVQYLVTADGVCPLLDADGTPLLVAEAGE